MSRYPTALILLIALAGCRTAPERAPAPMPTIVKVPVTKFVPMPDGLTAPCPVTRPESRVVEQVVNAYNANVTALLKCNAQLDQIRALQP